MATNPETEPRVPESILKKRATRERISAQRTAAARKAKATRRVRRKEITKRAEQYALEYRDAERAAVEARRAARREGKFYVPEGAKVAFVIRIRGIRGVAPKPRKILQLLRLRQLHNGVFLKINYATLRMLQAVEPYVAYGYPNLKSVRELLYKRGCLKMGRLGAWSRMPITDNDMIEKALGKHGIVCTEDMVHELFTCGPHFKQVNKALWPFKLSAPKGGFSRVGKLRHFVEGGEHGNREHLINQLIRKMN
ncbi:hypothetical protein CDCA_CDCA09G2747 [Cyanidium caldarium]|uniref:60S ribosomal protein L7 n=1 Tax=Cyanidium caldarium TaxID=2771 RepID=A0AAV9IWS9_CYACA|nr:hypothetical protein CDCA_CDCA09G2747 [Cyanidium caldarium]